MIGKTVRRYKILEKLDEDGSPREITQLRLYRALCNLRILGFGNYGRLHYLTGQVGAVFTPLDKASRLCSFCDSNDSKIVLEN